MDLVIRHVAEGDVEALHEILTSPHVVSGSMRVPLAPLRQTRERLAPARGTYQLVAEAEGRVVGFGNTHAVKLYEQAGFAIEGTMPRTGFGAGGWMDAHVMGRLRDP